VNCFEARNGISRGLTWIADELPFRIPSMNLDEWRLPELTQNLLCVPYRTYCTSSRGMPHKLNLEGVSGGSPGVKKSRQHSPPTCPTVSRNEMLGAGTFAPVVLRCSHSLQL